MENLAPLALAAPVLLAAAVFDLRHMRIPNALSVVLATIFAAACLATLPGDFAMRLIVAGSVLVLGAAAFFAGLVGAGDVKLLTTLLLLVPAAGMPVFALEFSAALAVTMAALFSLKRLPVVAGLGWRGFAPGREFPMGVAIALAGLSHPWVIVALS